ncbi:Ig-like domain-containing protein, partial [Streptomyces sp. 8N706]|uniref:Ig-like domain-containing protein n=1 Tax=Streptomyces sp. 8N706 TaxID=3457416 RepID=UPI003FD47C5B
MAISTTTLTSAPDPSVVGQTVTFTATVTDPLAVFTPTGTVDFVIDGGPPVTVALDGGGQATLSTSSLSAGPHTAVATYSGDANLDPSSDTDTQQVNPAATTTTLTSSPNPSVCGEPVTFTAQVTPVPPGAGTPTGTVTFIISADGPALTVPVDGTGQAQVTVSDLSVGNHVVIAAYSGDSEFSASTSGLLNQTVTPAQSATAVTVTPDPSVCGETVTVCATLTAVPPGSGTPTGVVTFTGPGGLNQTVPVDGTGQACFTTTTLATGTITATYGGDDCFTGSSNTAGVTVNEAATTTAVTATPDPSVCGETVTVCATVTATPPGSGTPTGTVTFTEPGGLNQTVALDGTGQACFTTTTLTTGTITATYNGEDTCFTGSVGSVGVTVNQASSTTTVTATPDPSVCGETVTVCATVVTNPPGSGTPTGVVTFTGPGGLNQTVPLDGTGQACFTTTALAAGTITATYGGDTCVTGSSDTVGVTVNEASTTTTVTATPNPSVCGETVTVCATVTTNPPGTGTPTGTVTFTGPGGLNQTVPLDGTGQACFTTTTLAAGTVTATYNGEDPCFTGSTGTVVVTVNEAATTTSVTVTPNPSVCGETVTVCATVTTNPPGTGTPTGTVTFTEPGGLNQTVPLDGTGQACFTTTTLTTGTVTAT